MKKIVRLTESDMNRLVRRIINEGVMDPAAYSDVSAQMKRGAQTPATLYFDKYNNIRLKVGNYDAHLLDPSDDGGIQKSSTSAKNY